MSIDRTKLEGLDEDNPFKNLVQHAAKLSPLPARTSGQTEQSIFDRQDIYDAQVKRIAELEKRNKELEKVIGGYFYAYGHHEDNYPVMDGVTTLPVRIDGVKITWADGYRLTEVNDLLGKVVE